MDRNQSDVIVIGAGMAGLAAARRLAASGLRVLLFEAQQRVGGRILTTRDRGMVIELGAEFIHGRAPELWDLIAEAGLETYERTGDFLQSGAAGPESMPDAGQDGSTEDPLTQLETFAGPDCSFAAYLSRIHLSDEQKAEQLAYVEGFNAADAQEASALALGRQQAAEDAIEGDRSWRLSAGYDQLPEFLLSKFLEAGGQIAYGAHVQQIAWGRGNVSIQTPDSPPYQAPKAIVTVPLGVLQGAVIEFKPVPEIFTHALHQMRMGSVFRCTLTFTRRFWPENTSFLLSRDLLPNVWWTAHPMPDLSLTGWVGGPRATALRGRPQAQVQAEVLAALAQALHRNASDLAAALTGFHTHDWLADPASHGAYSWVPVGGLDASKTLSQPVEGTLFFAGEHTDTTGHWGTVHAALRSGLRAAAQVLAG